MIDKVSMKAKGYKGANPKFPDQTTADQFFDEEQFEAYRELGYRIAEQAVDDLKLDKKLRENISLDKASLDKFRTLARGAARTNCIAFNNIRA